MLKQILNKGTLSFTSAILVLVIMPLYIWYIPPFMVAWGFFWILELYLIKERSSLIVRKQFWLFFLFLFFYIWQSAGILYSDNIKYGLAMAFSRLSLLLFPLVLAAPGQKIRKNVTLLLKLFALSTALFTLICFCNSISKFLSINNGVLLVNPNPPEGYWLNYFFASYFSINQHPTYLSMYVIISVFIALESWLDKSSKVWQKSCWLAVTLFLLISLYFLSSRSALLAATLLIPLYFFYNIKGKWQRISIFLAILLLVIALFGILITNDRFKYIKNDFSNISITKIGYEDERLTIWQSSLRIIRRNLLFGVGIGDTKSELVKEYKNLGDAKLIEKQYNVHNQYLEILLENGLTGLVLFFSLLGLMIYIAITDRNLLYGLFIIMMLIFFLFETVLNRLQGVSFFSLFSFLLIYAKPGQKRSENKPDLSVKN